MSAKKHDTKGFFLLISRGSQEFQILPDSDSKL